MEEHQNIVYVINFSKQGNWKVKIQEETFS